MWKRAPSAREQQDDGMDGGIALTRWECHRGWANRWLSQPQGLVCLFTPGGGGGEGKVESSLQRGRGFAPPTLSVSDWW